MGDGQQDPKQEKKKFYITVFSINVVANLIYYFLYFFLNSGPFIIVSDILSFPT